MIPKSWIEFRVKIVNLERTQGGREKSDIYYRSKNFPLASYGAFFDEGESTFYRIGSRRYNDILPF